MVDQPMSRANGAANTETRNEAFHAFTVHRHLLRRCCRLWRQSYERLKDIACRCVHLAYDAPPGVAFHNEVTVDRSAPGTYFCACG